MTYDDFIDKAKSENKIIYASIVSAVVEAIKKM